MHPLFQKGIRRGFVSCCALILAGCADDAIQTVSFDALSFSIPPTLRSIAPETLDNTQIIHNIVGAWKNDDMSLILSESSLPTNVTIKDFAEQASKRIAQQMIGYTHAKITAKSFSCDKEKITGYLHSFDQQDISDSAKITTYYNQFAFLYNTNVYILSLAQKTDDDVFSDILGSLGCTQTKE